MRHFKLFPSSWPASCSVVCSFNVGAYRTAPGKQRQARSACLSFSGPLLSSTHSSSCCRGRRSWCERGWLAPLSPRHRQGLHPLELPLWPSVRSFLALLSSLSAPTAQFLLFPCAAGAWSQPDGKLSARPVSPFTRPPSPTVHPASQSSPPPLHSTGGGGGGGPGGAAPRKEEGDGECNGRGQQVSSLRSTHLPYVTCLSCLQPARWLLRPAVSCIASPDAWGGGRFGCC